MNKNTTILHRKISELYLKDINSLYLINNDKNIRQEFRELSIKLTDQAYALNDENAIKEIHNILFGIYEKKFSTIYVNDIEYNFKPIIEDISSILEEAIIKNESKLIDMNNYLFMIKDKDSFIDNFKKLIKNHDAFNHPFYKDFLRNNATEEDFAYYLTQESALDPRFDDILALLQIGLEANCKMELASNYWDEMGNGKLNMVHSTLFSQILSSIDIKKYSTSEDLLLHTKLSSNISSCLALEKRNFYKALGYFGVIEYMTPHRFQLMVKGWERLGLPKKGIEYHKLHIKVDVIHGSNWFKNLIVPFVLKDDKIALEIIQGALIRLNTSKRYLDELYNKITI